MAKTKIPTNNEWIIRKKVFHPGQKANFFFEEAKETSDKFLEENIPLAILRGTSFSRENTGVKRELGKIVTRARDLALAQAKKRAPRSSGELAKSITAEKTSSTSFDLVTDVPYASSVGKGARPHIILPREARALKWKNTKNNKRRR